VLLYELLVGALPFEGKFLRRAGLAEMIRVISEEVPLTPSAKITQLGAKAVEIAQLRRTNPPHLRSQLDGDLNWIVMKALEKDRSRRYASMSEFAADVERHLSDQPVLAGPPNPLYRGYKFARRHRISVVAGLVVALSLIAGVISTSWEAHVAVLQRDRADVEAAAARESRAAAQKSEQDAKKSEARAQDSLANLLNAQAELQHGLEVQTRLTREARVRELVADAAQWQATDPALALYLGWRVAQMGRPLPPGLEDVLATSLANGPAYRVWRGRANLVAWSPDWKTLASVDEDRFSIVLSDPATGKPLRTLRGPGRREMTSVAWSPDGNSLASANYDGYILLWSVATGNIVHTLQNAISPGLGAPSSVIWSPDGKILAAATWEPKKIRPAPPASPVTGTIRLWAAESGQPLRTLQSDFAHSLAWSPDGRLLASSGGGKTIQLWDVASGEPHNTISGYSARRIAWSPDGKTLASAGEDRTIRLLEPASGRFVRAMEGHRDSVDFVTWSPDGKMLATASRDRTIRLWDVASGESLHTFRGHRNNVSGLTWSTDGRTLASAGEDRTIRFWDASKRQFDAIESSKSRIYGYNSVAVWSPRAKILAYVVDDRIRLWDSVSRADTAVTLQDRFVVSLTWSPDGRTLASAAGDNSIRLWDPANGGQLRAWQEGHQQFGSVGSLAWSPDGRLLASAGHPTVRVWDAASGRMLHTLSHAGAWRMAWSPDGRTLASGGGDKTVRLWDSRSGKLLRTLQHPGGVNSIAWSPDGRTVASACEQTVLLWDAASGRALRSVQVEDGSVLSVAWSPDSTTVSAACGACGCVLWEAASGRALRSLSSGYVSSSAWSADGQFLATAGSDGIRLWPGTVDALLDQVRHDIRLYTPSPAECRQYFASDRCASAR
jgi:WD40 repeat protein